MTTRSLMLLIVATAGCSSKPADTPVAKPVEPATPAKADAVAAADTQPVSIPGGAGQLRVVEHDDGRVDFTQLVNGVSTVIATTTADVSSVFDVRQDGEAAFVVERRNFVDGDAEATQVWRFRWDAATRTFDGDGHAQAIPGEELSAWVPADLRERHARRDRFVHGEEQCPSYSDRVKTSVMLDHGVEAMLICNEVQLAAYLVVFEGDQRHALHRFENEERIGLVQDPRTGDVVAIADREAFSVQWDGFNGPGIRPLEKVPAFAKAVMP